MDLLANRFRVLSELGRGGMGVVYRVADTLHGDREVALKTIQVKGGLTPELALRFREEFRAMARLRHPNTITVHDFGQLDAATRYLTMEIVPGRELTDLLEGGGLPIDQACGLLIQLLQALSFIHARLYVHRDIKAENIRIRDDGTLKLMDFGLMDQLGKPSSGKITGTLGYMPPEVPRGGVIDASSDLYSVGCLAFEILTGRLPFGGGVHQIVRAHMEQAPPSVRAARPDAPERLAAIVARLLEKDARRRYRQASDVIADLADVAGLQVARESLEQRRSYLTSSVLVGRDRELADLQAALADAVAGRGGSVFVGAPAGVGKSRLVHELVLHAKLNDVTVLHGQCLETGMAPYEPLAHALRPLVALTPPEELEARRAELSTLLPELGGDAPAEGLAAGDPEAEKRRLLDAVVGWLRAASARTPLVLFFDDLHWGDTRSVEAFNHCIRELKGDRVLCLATFRNDEAPAGSPLWFSIDDGATRYLKLTAFNVAQVMLLLQAMLHELRIGEHFTRFLFDTTAGNAFFLTEVLRHLMEEGVLVQRDGVWEFPAEVGGLEVPGSVEGTVVRRLGHLTPEARALAQVASVLGRYQDRGMLLAASGLDEEALFSRLDELVERQFLVKEDDGYTFPHDRVREALYAAMPEGDRQDVHQRCGEYLERAHADQLDAHLHELAHHFGHGRDRLKAYQYLERAGLQAKAKGIIATALVLLDQAATVLEELDLPDREVRLVKLWWEIGNYGHETNPILTVRNLEKLIPVLEAQGDALQVSAFVKGMIGDILELPPEEQAAAFAELNKPRVYQHVPGKGAEDPAWLGMVIEANTCAAICHGFSGRPALGVAKIQRALDLLPVTTTPLAAGVVMVQCISHVPAGHFDLAVEKARQAGEVLFKEDLTGQPPLVLATRGGAANFHNAVVFQGEKFDAKMVEYCHWAGTFVDIDFHNIIEYWKGIWYAWTGRQAEAMEVVDAIAQNCRKNGAPPFVWNLYLRPYLLWQRGELDEAAIQVEQAYGYAHLDTSELTKQMIRVLDGHVRLGRGDLEGALAAFQAAEQAAIAGPLDLVRMQALLGRGEVALAQGDAASAAQLAAEAHAMAADGPARNPLHQALAARLAGDAAAHAGDPLEAHRRYSEAFAIVSRPEQDNLIEQGHLLARFGELALASGNADAARQAFARAGELFHGLKNRHLLRPVAARLEALQAPAQPTLDPVAPEPERQTRGSLMATHWEKVLEAAGSDEAAFHQHVLTACLEVFQADQASLFRAVAGRPLWAASRTVAGHCEQPAVNPDHLTQVLADGQGLVAVDIPADLRLDAGSNIGAAIPSVLVAPVAAGGGVESLLHLLRHDIANPFEAADLDALTDLCSAIALRRDRPSTLQATTQIADDLRKTFTSLSMHQQAREDLHVLMLQEYAARLQLDEVVLVMDPEGPAARTLWFPTSRKPVPAAIDLVTRIARAERRGTRVAGASAATPVADGTSLVVAEFQAPDAQGVLVGVRRDRARPISLREVPDIDACTEVLRAALAGG